MNLNFPTKSKKAVTEKSCNSLLRVPLGTQAMRTRTVAASHRHDFLGLAFFDLRFDIFILHDYHPLVANPITLISLYFQNYNMSIQKNKNH